MTTDRHPGDRQVLCDCQFKETCQTYGDRSIGPSAKSAGGLGCSGQNDLYRGRHCRAFQCKCLSFLLSDMLGGPADAKTS